MMSRFPQFTLERLHANYAYSKTSTVYLGHPSWPTCHPLTLAQCELALHSSDALSGWLRTNHEICFCDCCMNLVGNAHAEECPFTGVVGALEDATPHPPGGCCILS